MSLDLTSSISSTDSIELSLFEEKATQIAQILDDHGFGHFSEDDVNRLESTTDFNSLKLVVGEIINDRLKNIKEEITRLTGEKNTIIESLKSTDVNDLTAAANLRWVLSELSATNRKIELLSTVSNSNIVSAFHNLITFIELELQNSNTNFNVYIREVVKAIRDRAGTPASSESAFTRDTTYTAAFVAQAITGDEKADGRRIAPAIRVLDTQGLLVEGRDYYINYGVRRYTEEAVEVIRKAYENLQASGTVRGVNESEIEPAPEIQERNERGLSTQAVDLSCMYGATAAKEIMHAEFHQQYEKNIIEMAVGNALGSKYSPVSIHGIVAFIQSFLTEFNSESNHNSVQTLMEVLNIASTTASNRRTKARSKRALRVLTILTERGYVLPSSTVDHAINVMQHLGARRTNLNFLAQHFVEPLSVAEVSFLLSALTIKNRELNASKDGVVSDAKVLPYRYAREIGTNALKNLEEIKKVVRDLADTDEYENVNSHPALTKGNLVKFFDVFMNWPSVSLRTAILRYLNENSYDNQLNEYLARILEVLTEVGDEDLRSMLEEMGLLTPIRES